MENEVLEAKRLIKAKTRPKRKIGYMRMIRVLGYIVKERSELGRESKNIN